MSRIETLIEEIRIRNKKRGSDVFGLGKDKTHSMRSKKSMSLKTVTEIFGVAKRRFDRVVVAFHYLSVKNTNLIKELENRGGYDDVVEILKIDMEIKKYIEDMLLDDLNKEELEKFKEFMKYFTEKIRK